MHSVTENKDERLLSEVEAAGLLGFSPRTLQAWRYATPPRGPRFVRISEKAVRYRRADLDAWVSSCVRRSTREGRRDPR